MTKARKKRTVQSQLHSGYIISQKVDFWMTGGVSIIVMSMLLIYIALTDYKSSAPISTVFGGALLLHVLINWPHFMASYGLLYRPKTNIQKYKSSTIYVPIALLSIIIISLVTKTNHQPSMLSVNQDIAYFLWLVAAFYLAWHYTGQAWGMIATYSRLSGLELNAHERLTIRFGLRLLLLWHVVWGAQDLPKHWFGGLLNSHIDQLMFIINILACLAFLSSLVIWVGIKNRTGKAPDLRILASWLSIYMWYLVLYFMPEAYLFVQVSHALQYLPFPLRVELNRVANLRNKAKKISAIVWGAKYYVLLIMSGMIIFYLPEYVLTSTEQFTLAFMISSAISIHHYFIDSCIWRISNRDVKKSLFSHLVMKKNNI